MSTSAPRGATPDYDVAIVGCGPVGLVLANLLRRYGHRVAIFDVEVAVFRAPRAYGLDDETMRTLQSLGLDRRLAEEGHIYEEEIAFNDGAGNRLVTFNAETLGDDVMSGACGHHYWHIFDQPSLERLLREDFEAPGGADAWLGWRVEAVGDAGDVVQVDAVNVAGGKRRRVEAAWVVGCDGARSTVRRGLQVPRRDMGYSEKYLVVDAFVADEAYREAHFPHGVAFTLHPVHAGIVAKGCHGMVRLDALRHPLVMDSDSLDEASYEDAAWQLIERRGFDRGKFELVRHAPYTFRASMPERWRVGRVLLAGDAAHLTPPWSGQGLNMGVRDATNLAFKLDLVLRGLASQTVLDTYQTERQPASWETIKAAVQTGKVMQAKHPAARLARTLVFAAARRSRSLRRKIWYSWQRKPPYTAGLVGGSHALAGHLARQPLLTGPDGTRVRLDDLVGLHFGLLTTESAGGPAVERFVRDLGGVVVQLDDGTDPGREARGWLAEHGAAAVLMRPDRYVFDAGDDPAALCHALFSALGAPDGPVAAR